VEVPKEEIFDLNMFGKWKTFGNSIVEIKTHRIVFDRINSNLKNMTLFEKNSKLLITDCRKNDFKIGLHLSDLNGNLRKSFNPGNKLTCPGAICTFSDKEEIFIANQEKLLDKNKNEEFVWKILVFQSNFEVKFEFSYSRIPRNFRDLVREDLGKLHTPDYMQIDNEHNNTRLYISDHIANKISIYNTDNGEQIDAIKITSPGNMTFSQNYIYVARFAHCMSSVSCIYKIRKDTFEVERMIVNRDSHTKTHLLGFDQLNNIILLAYDYIDVKTLRNYYLVIDENGKTITKYLTDLTEVQDALLLKDVIYIISKNDLKELEFCK
jgi:hypothetical protein